MKYKEQLLDYLDNYEDTWPLTKIAELIYNEDKSIKLSLKSIKTYLYTLNRDRKKAITVNNKSTYKVVGDRYVFEHKGEEKIFSIELIDTIFTYYVRRGYNFTRAKIQQRFNLTPENFNLIQRRFHLSKESDLFSPHTKQNTSKEELSVITDNLMQEVINSGEMTSQKYEESLKRKYRKIINKENLDTTWKKEVISELLQQYPDCEIIKLKKSPGPARYTEISVNVTDIHGGSKAEKMKITQDWSVKKLELYLDRVANITNTFNCPKVHLNLLGDLVETVSGINHPDSWKLIEDGMFGSKTIIETKNILIRFFNKINNLYSINGVGGNHDRLQSSNKLADTGATDLIFALIKERFRNTDLEVNYDPILLSLDREGYGEILCHGDKGLHKRSIEYLFTKFAIDKSKFQFINTGHWHSLQIKNNDSQEIARRIVFPSIITGNYYSDVEIGKADKSGFGINTVNMYGEPVLIIHNI